LKLTIGQKYYDAFGDDMVAIDLKSIPKGEFFKRKVDAKKVYTKESYNRKSSFGHVCFANWQCDDQDDISRSVYLKPSTIVLIGFCY